MISTKFFPLFRVKSARVTERINRRWELLCLLGGLFYFGIFSLFDQLEFQPGILGLLIGACVLVLSAGFRSLKLSLCSGLFASLIVSISYQIPRLNITVSAPKIFAVGFVGLWLIYVRPKAIVEMAKTPAGYAWLCVLVSVLASTLLSVGAVEWTGKLLNVIEPFLVAAFFFAAWDTVRKEEGTGRLLLRTIMLASLLVFVSSLIQQLLFQIGVGSFRLAWTPDNPSGYAAFSTIQHPNFISALAGMALALSFIFLHETHDRPDILALCTAATAICIVPSARSLAGLLIICMVLLGGLVVFRFSRYIRGVLVFGIAAVAGSAAWWGITKAEEMHSYRVRAYVYRVIFAHQKFPLWLGMGPAGFPEVFARSEQGQEDPSIPAWRRGLKPGMTAEMVRLKDESVVLRSTVAPLRLMHYDAAHGRPEAKSTSLLERARFSARVRTDEPGSSRLVLQAGEGYFFSPFHPGDGTWHTLVAQAPARIRNAGGWIVEAPASTVLEPAIGVDGKKKTAFSIAKGPFTMKFNLKDWLGIHPHSLRGKKVAAGVWVKAGRPGRMEPTRAIEVSLFDGKRNFSTSYHPGDGRWKFMTVKAEISPEASALHLNIQLAEGAPPIAVDGIFFDDGRKVFGLTPGAEKPPKTELHALMERWKGSGEEGDAELPPGWEFSVKPKSGEMERGPGRDWEPRRGLVIRRAPVEMDFDLRKTLSLPLLETRGREVAVGAWVRAGLPGQMEPIRSIQIQFFDGKEYLSADFHPGDGRWHFMSVKGRMNPEATGLHIKVQIAKNAPLVSIDGVFFRDEKRLVALMPRSLIELGFSAANEWDVTGDMPMRSLPASFVSGFAGERLSLESSIDRYVPSWLVQRPEDAQAMPFSSIDRKEKSDGPLHVGVEVLSIGKSADVTDFILETFNGRYNLSKDWMKYSAGWRNASGMDDFFAGTGWSLAVEGWSQNVSKAVSAHSTFLIILVERGILGLLAFLALTGAVLRGVWTGGPWGRFTALALGAILLSSLVEDTLVILRFSLLFWAVAAAGLGHGRQAEASSPRL